MGFLKDTDGIARSLKSDKDITFRYSDSDVATYLPTNTASIACANLTQTGANYLSVQNITGPGTVNVTTTVTLLTTTGADAYDLPDGGVEGQLKIISMKVNGGNGTVTPDNFVNGTQILFNNVEDTITLLWQSTGWVVLARQNATVT